MGTPRRRFEAFLAQPGPLNDALGALEAKTGVKRTYLATGERSFVAPAPWREGRGGEGEKETAWGKGGGCLAPRGVAEPPSFKWGGGFPPWIAIRDRFSFLACAVRRICSTCNGFAGSDLRRGCPSFEKPLRPPPSPTPLRSIIAFAHRLP